MSEPPTTGPTPIDLRRAPIDAPTFATRYEVGALLGRGGMGEVHTCRDVRIGREVAMKAVRRDAVEPTHGPGPEATSPPTGVEQSTVAGGALDRFVREARVQGQLEHPAIVPVYDLGYDPDGLPFFTMKRVRGLSLSAVLTAHRERARDMIRRFSERKLLSDLASLCLAADFAHRSGVLHRDIKPDNIMLGDFGEVYLLDWGIAKVLGDGEGESRGADTGTGGTLKGQVLGTPAYSAPEQLRGDTAVDARADVYALGAVLFEILALEPLHAGESLSAAERSVLAGVDVPARLRASGRGVAPELGAICARAVAREAGERFPSARALYEAIDGYLEGDRDLQRRRELAALHAASAGRAAVKARDGDETARAEAMREAGQAVALDPENREAAGVLAQLLLSPPERTPAEVERALQADDESAMRKHARQTMWLLLAGLLSLPLMLWIGVRDFRVPAGISACQLALVALYWWGGRATTRTLRDWHVLGLLAGQALFVALLTRFWGPLIQAPVVATMLVAGSAVIANDRLLAGRFMRISTGMYSAAIVAPFALELLGVLSPSYVFRDGTMVLLPNAVALPQTPTLLTTGALCLFVMLCVATLIRRVAAELQEARRRLALQAWQLGLLMPSETRAQTV